MPLGKYREISRRQYVNQVEVGDFVWVEKPQPPPRWYEEEVAFLSLVIVVKQHKEEIEITTIGTQGRKRTWFFLPTQTLYGIFKKVC